MAKKRSVQADLVRPFAGQPFAFVGHTHADYPPTFADLTARDAITGDQRYEGVIAYVLSDNTTYQLRGGSENTDWVTLVSATGVASHNELADIGTTSHANIDAHIADATLHFTQASISITESQINDLQSYSLSTHNHDATYLAIAAASASTDALETTTVPVNVSAAVAPITGQVLTATSGTTATWQTISGGGSGDIVQVGSPLDTHVAYFTADKNLSGDANFTWNDATSLFSIKGTTPELRIQDTDSAAGAMVASIDFWSSTALVAQLGFLIGGGNLALKNTAGTIILETATGTVTVTGAGDLSLTGSITGYEGTPTDGQILTWVTANGQAEFITAPTGIVPDGTPLNDQIVVFTSATNAEGNATFTWSGTLFTAEDFSYNSATDKVVIGDGVLSGAGIDINASVAGNPAINLQRNSVTQAIWKINNTLTRTEFSSVADNITLRPGNVDTITFTQALTTLTSNLSITGSLISNLTITNAEPRLEFLEDDAAVDVGLWDISAIGGNLYFRAGNDARTVYDTFMRVYRTAGDADWIEFLTEGASFNIGELYTAASTATTSGFNLGIGVKPTTTFNGNIWATATDIGAKIGGVESSLINVVNKDAVGNIYGGVNAGVGITTGIRNVILGEEAGRFLTSADNSVAIGFWTLRGQGAGVTGDDNTAIGGQAMEKMLAGTQNTAVGWGSLQFEEGGSGNTSIGWGTLLNQTGEDNNTALGFQAGNHAYSTSGAVFLGYDAGPTGFGSVDNELFIHNARSDTPLIHGNFATPELTINGALTVTGNVVIGATALPAWSTSFDILQLGTVSSIYGGTAALGATVLARNVYHDGANKYIATDQAQQIVLQGTGDILFRVTPSPTPITAGSFVGTTEYRIETIGTTDFTLIGAASNTVGLVFTATGVGSGTGTATPTLIVWTDALVIDNATADATFNGRILKVGTALVAGDFALSAGWGTTASVGTIVGNDQRCTFIVTSTGTGQAADPTITLTFTDGAWTVAPVAISSRKSGSQPSALAVVTSTTTTTVVITFVGTPVAAETFGISLIAIG